MKKVLFVATITEHINAFHIPYLKFFKNHGYEVHVASNGSEEIEYCDKHFDLKFERSPLKINNIKVYKKLKRIIDNNQYEIIHCHTPVGSVITRIAAKKSRIKYETKVIYTAHGFHFYKDAPIKNWILFYPIEKYLSKYTDILITINDEDYKIAKNKFYTKKVFLVNGVGVESSKYNLKISEEDKTNLLEKLNITKDDFVILNIGELNKNKNQIMLINSIKKIKSKKVKVLICGEGPLYQTYTDEIKKNKLENSIYMLGYRNDISKILNITDILVSCSKREGLPINIIEARISGIPSIATNCRGNRDLIENNINGYLVDIDDYKKLAFYIDKLYEDRKLLDKIKISSKQDSDIYTLNNVMNEMKSIYESTFKGDG